MKAITTKYLPATSRILGRVIASDGAGHSVTLFGDNISHREAALALCRKMRWEGALVEGSIKDGQVFVWLDNDACFMTKCPACGTNGNHYCPADVARD